jgi:hypothetical protein
LTLATHTVTTEPANFLAIDQQAEPAHRRRRVSHRAVALSTGVVLVASVLAGCGSSTPSGTTSSTAPAASTSVSAATSADETGASGSTSAGYPAGKEDVCQARDDLKTSIAALTDTKVLASGTDGIKAAVADVKTKLSAFAAAGKDDYRTEVDALQKAVDDLETALGNLGTAGVGGGNAAAIAGPALAVQQAATALFTKLTADCGS